MKDRETYNNLVVEVMEAERLFCEHAAEKGVQDAFLAFAAKEAVINRNDKIYAGKEEIRQYFEAGTMKNVDLKWKPDYVDVSDSGDLAWTYGKYTFSGENAEGKIVEAEGIFHTVWKRQSDGSWKYVWD